MVKHIAKIVLGEELYNIKDTEVRGDLNNHASNTDIHVTAAEKEYWNSKVNPPSYSAPTAKQLTYTGEAQDLLNPGSSTSGSIQYSTDEVNWSTTIPQVTNAGTYTVYWKFAGSEIVYVDSTAINVTIAKANPTYTAPTAKTLTYNGGAQELLNAGTTSGGTILYSEDNENWGSSIPQGTNAGSNTVYWKLTGDANHNNVASTSINVSISKVTPTVTAPTGKAGLEPTGSPIELVNAGSTNYGAMQYSLDNSNWSAIIPTATDEGVYTVYWRILGDTNVNDVEGTSIEVSIEGGWVDLGLPSGRKWAKGNIVPKAGGGYKIGEPTDYGAYFSWGNIVPHFSSNGSSFDDGYSFGSTNYDASPGKALTADIASNDAAHDAALACLGSSARMPTNEEFKELYDNTDREWVTIDGVNGWKFMKKSDHSVFVFFPAAGYGGNASLNNRGSNGFYWSSSYKDRRVAFILRFDSSDVYPQGYNSRMNGYLVRAVQ